MSRLRWYVLLAPALLSVLSLVACGEPPDKEMHQAQGAIDAARAVGAETYAPDEFKGAVDALARAQDAVAQRDYRLALNNALDSRERAQNAAKMAAEQRASARSAAERLLADVTSAIAVSAARLKAAETAHAPKTATEPLKAGLASARQATEDAGKALASQDYLGAKARLDGIVTSLSMLLQQLPKTDAVLPARSQKRPR
jgi:uncharacterized protein DUF4398